MSSSQSHTIDETNFSFGQQRKSDPPLRPGEFWSRSGTNIRTIRWVSLLYSGFFFIEPYYHRTLAHWLWFAVFYAAFLVLYFTIPVARGRLQQVLFALFFALGFVYFPFNTGASGVFVYPIVMLAFILRSTRTYLLVLAAQIVGICLEALLLQMHWYIAAPGVFFCVVVGLSNLAYSRQQQANYLLLRANDEIEHLAQVAERERIARDLHDLLGHTLTVIAIKSELANRLLDRDPARAKQEMLDVELTARKALADVREAVVGYRSDGIASEISRARRTLLAAGVTLITSVDTIETAPAIANVLCLTLREAVTNIVRHAHATLCTITLTVSGGTLRMTIADNGNGVQGREGSGLLGMRERCSAQLGTVRVLSDTATGTRVELDLPMAAHAETAQPMQVTT